jgi:phage I-like protein
MGSPQQKQLAALTAQPAIIFDNEGQDGKRKAPTEFRVFHAGVNKTDKGKFLFDEKAANQVIETYRQRGVPLMGDYEHQTVNAAKNGQPAPNSITEWVPEIRRDAQGGPELWATNVKWTDKARGMLEAGEYRMFSPLFTFDDDDDRRPNWMINLALTNNPATHGQEPLVAASAETTATKEQIMCELCGRLEAKMSAMADEHRAHLKGLVEDHTKQVESLTAKLASFEQWAAEESKEHGGDLTALSAFRRDVCALSGEKTLAGAIGVLKAHKVSHEQHAALKGELAAQKTAALTAEFNDKLGAAVKDGKITPAQKEFWQKQQLDLGVEKGLAMLSGYVATLSPIVSSTSITASAEGGEPNGLTAGQIAAAQKMGLKVEQLTAGLKFHQAQLATMQGRA